MPTIERLREMQAWPLERKIFESKLRIKEWYNHFGGNVYVSFSGGKDSTVLLDIARQCYPDIPAVYVDTGLEYPEVKQFVKSIPNHRIIIPAWDNAGKRFGKDKDRRIVFSDVITYYGYPIISKEISSKIYDARSAGTSSLTFLNYFENKKYNFDNTKYKALYSLPFRISDNCCDVMKKRPINTFDKSTGLKGIVGTMASDSYNRRASWQRNGCNVYDKKKIASRPLSFWKQQDILQYIYDCKLNICSVYGDVVKNTNGHYSCTGCEHTGCMFCAFGLHMESKNKSKGTRFQRLRENYPKIYDFVLGGGHWIRNDRYETIVSKPGKWNPREIWAPSRTGLGFRFVLDTLNDIYGKDFCRYE